MYRWDSPIRWATKCRGLYSSANRMSNVVRRSQCWLWKKFEINFDKINRKGATYKFPNHQRIDSLFSRKLEPLSSKPTHRRWPNRQLAQCRQFSTIGRHKNIENKRNSLAFVIRCWNISNFRKYSSTCFIYSDRGWKAASVLILSVRRTWTPTICWWVGKPKALRRCSRYCSTSTDGFSRKSSICPINHTIGLPCKVVSFWDISSGMLNGRYGGRGLSESIIGRSSTCTWPFSIWPTQ